MKPALFVYLRLHIAEIRELFIKTPATIPPPEATFLYLERRQWITMRSSGNSSRGSSWLSKLSAFYYQGSHPSQVKLLDVERAKPSTTLYSTKFKEIAMTSLSNSTQRRIFGS